MKSLKVKHNGKNIYHYACYITLVIILSVLAKEGFAETISEDLHVQGNVDITENVTVEGAITSSQGNQIDIKTACTQNDNSGDITISTGDSEGAEEIHSGDITIATGSGVNRPGNIYIKTGPNINNNPKTGSITLNANTIELKGNVQLDELTGLSGDALIVSGGAGLNNCVMNDGGALILSGGKGGYLYNHGWGKEGDVIVQSVMDMQGNELKNAHIAPCGGLSMGDFDSE